MPLSREHPEVGFPTIFSKPTPIITSSFLPTETLQLGETGVKK